MAKLNHAGEEFVFTLSADDDCGGTVVQARTGEGKPYEISLRVEGAPRLPKGQFYLKYWADNWPIVNAMFTEGLIEPVGALPFFPSRDIPTQAYQFTEKGQAYTVLAENYELLTRVAKRMSRYTPSDVRYYAGNFVTQWLKGHSVDEVIPIVEEEIASAREVVRDINATNSAILDMSAKIEELRWLLDNILKK